MLILGSLPGDASIAAGEYYAHPRNGFWAIIAELTGIPVALPYRERLGRLVAARLALWDVCAAAARGGSRDAAIRRRSVVANDLEPFLHAHPDIRLIAFNGATAAALFQRLVLPALEPESVAIARVRLPSTSPAHAALPVARKVAAWRAAVWPVLQNG